MMSVKWVVSGYQGARGDSSTLVCQPVCPLGGPGQIGQSQPLASCLPLRQFSCAFPDPPDFPHSVTPQKGYPDVHSARCTSQCSRARAPEAYPRCPALSEPASSGWRFQYRLPRHLSPTPKVELIRTASTCARPWPAARIRCRLLPRPRRE